MKGKVRIVLAIAGVCGLALSSASAVAQSARQSAGNAQMMLQLQQLAAERTQLLSENQKLKSDLEALRKERDELKKKQGGTEGRVHSSEVAAARAEREKTALQAELDTQKVRMQELIAKFRETATTLRDVETDRTVVTTSLTQRESELAQCIDRNQKLYALNGEILNKLDGKGSFTPGSVFEPFTRLKRVELENLIDGYQTRAEDLHPPATKKGTDLFNDDPRIVNK